METFSALLVLSEGNPPVTGGFPAQRPVTRSSDVFFEQTVKQTIQTSVILDAIALIMTSQECFTGIGAIKVSLSVRLPTSGPFY